MKKSKLERSRNRWGIVFILPQLLSLICLGIVPIMIAFVLSFFEWNGFGSPSYVGIANFKDVFIDLDTVIAIKNTFVYAVIYVPCSIVLWDLRCCLTRRGERCFTGQCFLCLRLLHL